MIFSLSILTRRELDDLVDALEARLVQEGINTVLADSTRVNIRRLYDRARLLQEQDAKRRAQTLR